MRNKKIIVFTGLMGSGKTEATKIIKELLNKDKVEHLKLAAVMYHIHDFIYETVGLTTKTKDRELLQFLGMWGRSKDEELWIKVLSKSIETSKADVIVIDDCRFDNEAKYLKDLGANIVLIKADNRDQRISISGSDHISEKGIDKKYIDCIIENNLSLTGYKEQLSFYLKCLNLL